MASAQRSAPSSPTSRTLAEPAQYPGKERHDVRVPAEGAGAVRIAARGDAGERIAHQEGPTRVAVTGILLPGPRAPAKRPGECAPPEPEGRHASGAPLEANDAHL